VSAATEIIPQEGGPLGGEDILRSAKELVAPHDDELRRLPPDIVGESRYADIVHVTGEAESVLSTPCFPHGGHNE